MVIYNDILRCKMFFCN